MNGSDSISFPAQTGTIEVDTNQKSILRGVSNVYVNKKSAVKRLVRRYNIPLPVEPTNEQLLTAMVEGFRDGNFRYEFAKLIANGEYQSITGAYSNAIDPVTAIAEGIGSIFGMVGTAIGSISQRKHDKEIAKQQMMQLILDNEKRKQQKGVSTEVVIVGGIIFLALAIGGVVIYKRMNK